MRSNTKDETLKRNYIQKYQWLIKEYEQIKGGVHPTYRRVKDFYQEQGTCPQTFLKYYARYRQSGGVAENLLPQKRGPRYQTRRATAEVEQWVLKHRALGCNKYEIHSILKNHLGDNVPSPSGVYTILKRHGHNKLTRVMKEEKQRIIKEKAGLLGHIDCHHLSKDMIVSDQKRRYLVCVIDSCTRIAWAEVVEDIQALTVMFATLRCFNHIVRHYQIQFAEVLTDNGPEFGIKQSQCKEQHPFERMLMEMGIQHRYTRPYRPQTNGKVERFWRTLNEDLINETYFNSIDHFKDELYQYLVYYNELRPHQALNGSTPLETNKKVNENHQRIT